MALHPDLPDSPYAILDPEIRWFPADEALRDGGGVTGWREAFLQRKRKTPALVTGVGPRRENLGVVQRNSNGSGGLVNE